MADVSNHGTVREQEEEAAMCPSPGVRRLARGSWVLAAALAVQPGPARAAGAIPLPGASVQVRALSADPMLESSSSAREADILTAPARSVTPKAGFIALELAESPTLLLPVRPGNETRMSRVLADAVRGGASTIRVDIFPTDLSPVGQFRTRAYTPRAAFLTDGYMPLPGELRGRVVHEARAWDLPPVPGPDGIVAVDDEDAARIARVLAEEAVDAYNAWTLTCEQAEALQTATAECEEPVYFPAAPWAEDGQRVRVTPASITRMLGTAAQRYLDVASNTLEFEEVQAFERNVAAYRAIADGCGERFRDWYAAPDGRSPRFVLDGRTATPEWIEKVRHRIGG